MKIFVQSRHRPSQVLFAFDDVTSPKIEGVRWAVAYSTLRGCQTLVKRVSDRMGSANWEASQKFFITSIDFGLTEPSALEFLSNQPHSQVHIANPQVSTFKGFFPAQAYHPKVYLFDQPQMTGYVVGSANLTLSALTSNTEVVSTGHEAPANRAWNDFWSELMKDAGPLTGALLASYRKDWSRPSLRPVEPDPLPIPPVIRAKDKPVFWDVISSGGLDPLVFEHFWVEAGSMSSGGSHNQLELPRGGNRFFGFTFNRYGDEHVKIGYPVLTLGQLRWSDRPLTWHGNNKMERINLPTQSQGGFDYQNTAVLFRRHSGRFEINVSSWDDATAVSWRAASESLGTVFRLGEKGQRICGLF